MVEIELYLRRTFCFLLPKSTTTDEEKKTKSKEINRFNYGETNYRSLRVQGVCYSICTERYKVLVKTKAHYGYKQPFYMYLQH